MHTAPPVHGEHRDARRNDVRGGQGDRGVRAVYQEVRRRPPHQRLTLTPVSYVVHTAPHAAALDAICKQLRRENPFREHYYHGLLWVLIATKKATLFVDFFHVYDFDEDLAEQMAAHYYKCVYPVLSVFIFFHFSFSFFFSFLLIFFLDIFLFFYSCHRLEHAFRRAIQNVAKETIQQTESVDIYGLLSDSKPAQQFELAIYNFPKVNKYRLKSYPTCIHTHTLHLVSMVTSILAILASCQ